MAGTFSPEVTYGVWSWGTWTEDGRDYKTLRPASTVSELAIRDRAGDFLLDRAGNNILIRAA